MLKYMSVKVFVTDGMRKKPQGSKNRFKSTVWAFLPLWVKCPFCFLIIDIELKGDIK